MGDKGSRTAEAAPRTEVTLPSGGSRVGRGGLAASPKLKPQELFTGLMSHGTLYLHLLLSNQNCPSCYFPKETSAQRISLAEEWRRDYVRRKLVRVLDILEETLNL